MQNTQKPMQTHVKPRPIKSDINIVGEITGRCYDQSKLKKWQHLWNRFVKWADLDFKKHYILGPMKWEDTKYNVVCNVGFQAMFQVLSGSYGDTGEINYAALGTSTTPVAASDVALGTEVYRNPMFSGTVSSNIMYLTAVYTETETSGTFEEFGNFIDGDAWAAGVGADTGEIWTHVLTGGWVKTITDVLVVDQKYTGTSS